VIEVLSAFIMFFYYVSQYFGLTMLDMWLAFDKYNTSGICTLNADGESICDLNAPGAYISPHTGLSFTGQQLRDALAGGQTAYFVALVIVQFGNLFGTKNQTTSLFSSNPFRGPRKNALLFISIPISLALALAVVYLPFCHSTAPNPWPLPTFSTHSIFALVIFNTRPISWEFWFMYDNSLH